MNSNEKFLEILQRLEKCYPGKFFLGVREVATIYGLSEKTIYNQTCRKAKRKFPVMPERGPGKRFSIVKIAQDIAGL